MNMHFVAIGGAAMHNLALALHHQGHSITGSDDEIFEPSRSRLQAAGLLPKTLGWSPQHIHPGIDAVILGMHAKANNPELLQALALNIPVYSYPSFLRKQTEGKTRLVVGGSHGKTTTTSLLMHGLKGLGLTFDYLVGAQIQGFERMVEINSTNNLAIIEGDEYLASAMEPVPKFHLYEAHLAILTGIAWDHINVFPTEADYISQFHLFLDTLAPNAILIYCAEDEVLRRLAEAHPRPDLLKIPYTTLPWQATNQGVSISFQNRLHELPIRGSHNVQNLSGALEAAQQLKQDPHQFLDCLSDFSGAARRMEILLDFPEKQWTVFRDFAHSPSKVKATVAALRESYPERQLFAALELHTYSSLNPAFISGYHRSLLPADDALVFYDPKALSLKKMPPLPAAQVAEAFDLNEDQIATTTEALEMAKSKFKMENSIWLLMSSGNWGGFSWV